MTTPTERRDAIIEQIVTLTMAREHVTAAIAEMERRPLTCSVPFAEARTGAGLLDWRFGDSINKLRAEALKLDEEIAKADTVAPLALAPEPVT